MDKREVSGKDFSTTFSADVLGNAFLGMSSLVHAQRQLNAAIQRRLSIESLTGEPSQISFPVGLCFVRGDRAGEAKKLADQLVASFGYWNADSSKYFDIVFPGWKPGPDTMVFDRDSFLAFRDELELACKWKYSGETDLLLLNYDYSVKEFVGDFRFDEVIYIPVEIMLKDGHLRSLDALMAELVRHAKATWPRSDQGVVWDISDRIGFERGTRSLWRFIRRLVLRDASKIYDELRPFAVCDLQL